MKLANLTLALTLLTGISSAFADPSVTCTGSVNAHTVKITQQFNATLDGVAYSSGQLTVAIDSVEVSHNLLPYSQSTTFYVSPDREIATLMLLNDGQQTLLNVEYLGKGKASNRVQISSQWIDHHNAATALLSLNQITCEITRQ